MKQEIELFDILSERQSLPIVGLARDMIELLILRFRRIQELDEMLDDISIDSDDRPAANAMREVYRQWADDAEAVIQRVSKLHLKVDTKSLVESLEHSVGRTRARLSLSLDDIAEGERQAERGELIPVAEVRDELRARAHS